MNFSKRPAHSGMLSYSNLSANLINCIQNVRGYYGKVSVLNKSTVCTVKNGDYSNTYGDLWTDLEMQREKLEEADPHQADLELLPTVDVTKARVVLVMKPRKGQKLA